MVGQTGATFDFDALEAVRTLPRLRPRDVLRSLLSGFSAGGLVPAFTTAARAAFGADAASDVESLDWFPGFTADAVLRGRAMWFCRLAALGVPHGRNCIDAAPSSGGYVQSIRCLEKSRRDRPDACLVSTSGCEGRLEERMPMSIPAVQDRPADAVTTRSIRRCGGSVLELRGPS